MTGKSAEQIVCRYCDLPIKKVRTPERVGGRVWRWATVDGERFYCPQAGADCWHQLADASSKLSKAERAMYGCDG